MKIEFSDYDFHIFFIDKFMFSYKAVNINLFIVWPTTLVKAEIRSMEIIREVSFMYQSIPTVPPPSDNPEAFDQNLCRGGGG